MNPVSWEDHPGDGDPYRPTLFGLDPVEFGLANVIAAAGGLLFAAVLYEPVINIPGLALVPPTVGAVAYAVARRFGE